MNKYILRKHYWGFVFLFVIFFSGINPAYAHKVMVFAWVDGDTVFTQSKFSGGKKVKGGNIAVYNTHEKILLEGKTDGKGEFAFKVPEKTTLKIVLQAGMGHRAEWTVPAEEIEDTLVRKTDGSATQQTVLKIAETKSTENQPEKTTQTTPSPGLSSDQIEQAVEKALDKKLKPVITILRESLGSGPTISEILGGIGYIFGLMGVGAYFHYRRRKD